MRFASSRGGYALALIADRLSDAEAQTVLGALVQHGEFIERHLSPGSSANNHLIGEAAALAFLGRVLPDGALAARWRRVGYATLEREALRQLFGRAHRAANHANQPFTRLHGLFGHTED